MIIACDLKVLLSIAAFELKIVKNGSFNFLIFVQENRLDKIKILKVLKLLYNISVPAQLKGSFSHLCYSCDLIGTKRNVQAT